MNRRNILKAASIATTARFLSAGQVAHGQARQIGRPADTPSGRFARTRRHTTFYLEAGPPGGTPVILLHGWPETSHAWRRQAPALAQQGFRVVAPDMRGCGRSGCYAEHGAYAQREIARDMIELADDLGVGRAVWVGHDWGAAVAWNVARHHPDRCLGVAALCVPYDTLERGLDRLDSLVNRQIYPAAEYPFGQFEYVKFYQEHFDAAQKAFEANLENTFKVILRKGDPTQVGKPYATAFVRKRGGWFGPGAPAPDVPIDTGILDESDLAAYVADYKATGFFGVNSLYMNDADNNRYADEAKTDIISMPALFLSGQNDFVNDAEYSELATPMKSKCEQLTYKVIESGHWMQHEQAAAVNSEICHWVKSSVLTA